MSLPFRRQHPHRSRGNDGNVQPNSMYTAFLLDHSDSSAFHNGYRLFIAGDGEEQQQPLLPENGGAAPNASSDEAAVANDAPPASAAAAAASNNSNDETRCIPCVAWTRLTRRNIHILNIAAALVHALLFVVIYWQASSKDKKAWRLKQDRIQVVPKAVGDVQPFVKIANDKCNLAPPNIMAWENSTLGTLQLWTYPQDAGMDVDLKWCVLIFFALSFAFQMGVSVYSFVAKSGYYSIFHNDVFTNVDTAIDTVAYKTLLLPGNPVSGASVKVWTDDILRFNWARFIEYTFSGSLVLFTIALIAGINDFELLLLIYVLSAACMLMGLGAEYCMRIMYALKVMAGNSSSNLSQGTRETISNIIVPQLRGAFWVLHVFAWVCILVPWYIIYLHYLGWWGQCTTPNAKGETVTPQPPDFVKVIIFAQGILFLLFGVVQLVQYFYPHKRRLTEVTYIGLSLTAKVLLGSMLAANVLVA